MIQLGLSSQKMAMSLPDSQMIKTLSKSLAPVLVLMMAAGSPWTVSAQAPGWANLKGQQLVEFDWSCSSPSAYPSAKLNRIVRATMKRMKLSGFGTWGDRAFAFDLNGDHNDEYFVPLDCGATGNCTWGIFSANPVGSLGTFNAQYIYLHRRADGHPDVVVYIHMSASEGILETYRFRQGKYVWLGDKHPTGDGTVSGNEMPVFFKDARPGCGTLRQ